jgi:DUF971 family protein
MTKPININLHQKSRVLEIEYEDGAVYQLPCEYLRVYSPSAEVTGHGPGQEIDKHDSGLYTWEYLYELGSTYEEKWADYLARLKAAGHERRQIS